MMSLSILRCGLSASGGSAMWMAPENASPFPFRNSAKRFSVSYVIAATPVARPIALAHYINSIELIPNAHFRSLIVV